MLTGELQLFLTRKGVAILFNLYVQEILIFNQNTQIVNLLI